MEASFEVWDAGVAISLGLFVLGLLLLYLVGEQFADVLADLFYTPEPGEYEEDENELKANS